MGCRKIFFNMLVRAAGSAATLVVLLNLQPSAVATV